MNKQELDPVQLELLNKYGFDHQLFKKLPEEMAEFTDEICRLSHFKKVGAIWIDEDGIKIIDPEIEIGVERFGRELVDMIIVLEQVKSMLDQDALARYREEALSKAKTKYLDKWQKLEH